jgi:hypothetical protein
MLILAIVLALLVVVVIFLVAGLIVGWDRRSQARQGDWTSRARDACTAADALHDQLVTRLSVAPSADTDEAIPAGKGNSTERSMDKLSAELQGLRFSAPNSTADQATEELIMALAAVRPTLQLQESALATSSGQAEEPVTTAEARLMEFGSAIRGLQAVI